MKLKSKKISFKLRDWCVKNFRIIIIGVVLFVLTVNFIDNTIPTTLCAGKSKSPANPGIDKSSLLIVMGLAVIASYVATSLVLNLVVLSYNTLKTLSKSKSNDLSDPDDELPANLSDPDDELPANSSDPDDDMPAYYSDSADNLPAYLSDSDDELPANLFDSDDDFCFLRLCILFIEQFF